MPEGYRAVTPATQILLFGKPFRIADYFRMGQIGWHWQFDDPLKRVGIHYEWTDTAGTTPVTAVGQGIGLLLGREYGGATGPSLLANGATGLTGTATAASYSTTTFAGSVSRAGDASNQSWVTWTGLTTSAVYRLRITNTGATSLDVRNGGVAGTIVASIAAGASTWVHPATTGGSTSITITATANSTTATFTLGQFAVLPGTHLTQATGTAKPTLSARVNLLLSTEGIAGSASWLTTNTTKADGIAGAPDGTATATRLVMGGLETDRLQFVATNPAGVGASVSCHHSIWVKSESGGLSIRLGEAGALDTIAITTAWTRIAATKTATTTVFTLRNEAGGGAKSLLVWHPDLRTADDAAKNIPAYQRVGATAADHDTDGFPHYALADGTDDCMASVSTVDGSATDKVTAVLAATKLSDAAAALVLEHTTTSGNPGSFGILAPSAASGNNFRWYARGVSAGVPEASANSVVSPVTSVFAGQSELSADLTLAFLNGVQTGSSATDAGTGNFANATMYVMARGGASNRFNGRFYGSTGRFGPMSDSERNNLTRWWQKRIGTA